MVLGPREVYQQREGPFGPGFKLLDEIDAFILLLLYLDELSRITSSYVEWLYHTTGTIVSKSTV